MDHPLSRILSPTVATPEYITCELTTGYKDKKVVCRIAVSDAWKDPSGFAARVRSAEDLSTFKTTNVGGQTVVDPVLRNPSFTSARWKEAEIRLEY